MQAPGVAFPWVRILAVWAGACVFAVVVVTVASSTDLVICEGGSEAGECSGPSAVAVDREAEIVYVADRGNRRIDVFEVGGAFVRAFGWDVAPEGSPGDTPANEFEICTSSCQAGSAGAGAGQFDAPVGIAVDNNPESTAHQDVYVFDGGANSRVQRFHPNGDFVLSFGSAGSGAGQFFTDEQLEFTPKLALGPGGVVHVAEGIPEGEGKFAKRLQKFTHTGAPVGAPIPLTDEPLGRLRAFAVDSNGDFYIANDGLGGSDPGVRKYDASGTPLKTFHSSFNIQVLAVDAADNLMVGEGTAIYAYTPMGTMFHALYGKGTGIIANSLAPLGGTESDLFASEGDFDSSRVVRFSYEPPGPVVHPNPPLTKAEPIGSTKATLNSMVNPEGKATNYWFEYVDDETYNQPVGGGFSNSQKTQPEAVTPPGSPAFAPELFQLAPVSAQIGCQVPEDPPQPGCLEPETTYHFRAVAENGDGGPNFGPEIEFETAPPFEILDTWATQVGADAARVHAEVNPLGIPLSAAHFEYVEEVVYLGAVKKAEEEGKTPEEAVEAGFAAAQTSAEVDFGVGEEPVVGSAQLHSLAPDTAYRYRIAIENFFKSEAGPVRSFTTFPHPKGPEPCANDGFRGGSSAHLPDCRAYEMVSPVDKEGGEIITQLVPLTGFRAELPQSAAVVPAQGRGITYSSSRAFGDAVSSPFTSQYIATRNPPGSPGEGWSSHGISPPRRGAPIPGLTWWLDTQYKAFSDDLRYGWLLSDSEPPLDLVEPSAIPGYPNLYRRDNATDSYEAICPAKPTNADPEDYVPAPQGFSADASVTVFYANGKLTLDASSKQGIFQLYGCAGGDLRLISVLPNGNPSANHSAAGTRFSARANHRSDSLHNAVSADGARIYWSTGAENSAGKLYLRENPFGEGAECVDPGAPCTRPVSEAVGGAGSDGPAEFWTASADGGRAIFRFSSGPLAGNLYEFDASAETNPAELIAGDVTGMAGFSEDATRLYFVSTEALTPDAVGGKANLYLHEAGQVEPALVAVLLLAGTDVGGSCGGVEFIEPSLRCTRTTADGGRLVFASRDPLTGHDNAEALSGEPTAQIFLYDAGEEELLCVSCNPGGARPQGREFFDRSIASQIPVWSSVFYATRVLSSDGRRLFFESYDALLPQDTNGALDVYQWEEVGKGDCEVADHNHFPQNGGCLALISSGRDQHDSEFIDASADGSDVFIRTAESLLPQDPGLLDIYDARIGGGFPLPARPDPPCEGEACQSPPPPPQASAPASSAFRGKGNPKKPCPKGKRKVRRRGKVRCLKPRKGKQRRGQHRRGGVKR